MKLRLILKGPERLMGDALEKSMEHGSLIIGRSPDADWTLPDPARMISKLHCRVDVDFSGFVLTDTSTNGVKVNEELVGFGLPQLLTDGDVLQLGDAVILVRIENDSAVSLKPQTAKQPASHHEVVGTTDGPFGTVVAPHPKTQSNSTSAGSAGLSIEQILDHWWLPESATSNSSAPIPSTPSADDTPTDRADPPAAMNLSASQPPGDEEREFAVPLAGTDLHSFASAIRTATEVLSPSERNRFQERLRTLLEQSAPQET